MATFQGFPAEVWYRIFDMLVTAYPYLPILFTHGLAIPHRYSYYTRSYETQITISNPASNFLNYATMGINCDMDDHVLNPLARIPCFADMVAKYRKDYMGARQEELAKEETFHLKFDNMAEMSSFFGLLTPTGKSRISRVTGRWDYSPKDTLQNPSYSRSEGSALLAFMVMEEVLPNLMTLEITINLQTLRRYHGDGKPRKALIEANRVVGMDALKRLLRVMKMRGGHFKIYGTSTESLDDLLDG